MEIQLRVVLLIAGLLILCIVGFDLYRRRPLKLSEFGSDNEDVALRSNAAEEYLESEITAQDIAELSSGRHPGRSHLSDVDQGSSEFCHPGRSRSLSDVDPGSSSYSDLNLYGLDLDENPGATSIAEDLYEQIIPPKPAKKIVAISVMARERTGFAGAQLLTALQNANLQYGDNEIFHRYTSTNTEQPLFSVAKAVEPGYFDVDLLPQQKVAGLTLFVVADHLLNPETALDQMVRAAKQIAFALNGELLDQNRQPLTLDTIEQYRVLINKK